jgi:hypothetical protein
MHSTTKAIVMFFINEYTIVKFWNDYHMVINALYIHISCSLEFCE